MNIELLPQAAHTPRVYVGTYRKYNNGNLEGDWLDLEDFQTAADFWQRCKAIHSDEVDPEIMIQDHEYCRKWVYRETVDDRVFDWLQLDEEDQHLVEAWMELGGLPNDQTIAEAVQAASDSYIGHAGTFLEYAEETAEEILAEAPIFLSKYFDMEAYAKDLEIELSTCETSHGVYIFQ